jgi:hypothetical protein
MSKLSKVFPDFNKKFTPGGVSDLTSRSFPMLSSPNCPNSKVMTTKDGNKDQTSKS